MQHKAFALVYTLNLYPRGLCPSWKIRQRNMQGFCKNYQKS